jgi:hypothetical protein
MIGPTRGLRAEATRQHAQLAAHGDILAGYGDFGVGNTVHTHCVFASTHREV